MSYSSVPQACCIELIFGDTVNLGLNVAKEIICKGKFVHFN